MRKLIVSILLMSVLAITAGATEIPAERQLPLLVDGADLLSTPEEAKLLALLADLSEKNKCEIAVVTVDDLGYKSATSYADDFFDYNGYGYGEKDDGVLLLVSIKDREWAISTHGKAHDRISESDLDTIEENLVPKLTSGKYYDAFVGFAEDCVDAIGFRWGVNVAISCVIGLLAGGITVGVMASQLKSVKRASGASNYYRNGSLNIKKSSDIYLYRTVSKVRIDNDSSSGGGHSSSSGRSHGGRSGRF